MSDRLRIFRWRAIGPLLFFLALLVVLWLLFADMLARRESAEALSDLLGTEVDIARLRIREADAAVDVGGLAIADPRDSSRNLIEAEGITVDLEPVALAEKKLVIDRVALTGLRFLTRRERPARRVAADGPTAQLIRQTDAWAREKFSFPAIAVGRFDTLKQLALDPAQLGTLKAARGVAARLDSVATGARQQFEQLATTSLVDSATALADRLAAVNPKQASPAEIKSLVEGVDQMRRRLSGASGQLAALEQTVRGATDELSRGIADVNAARQRDYEFARGLFRLPSLDAPHIGASLFGPVSLASFQRALVYAKVAQRYVPPGLQPWNRPGPRRARMDGTDVEFPKEHAYPRFLLRQGEVSLAAGAAGQHAFAARFGGITSQPALYGRPATLDASGSVATDSGSVGLRLSAYSFHAGGRGRDSLALSLTDLELPRIAIPGLPFTLVPGRGSVGFGFAMSGDRLAGTWMLKAPRAGWTADTSRLGGATSPETIVWRVVQGLTDLQVRAELGGTLASPTLAVHSNLDAAIANSLRSLVGEELTRAELKVRAMVDSLVGPEVAALAGRYEAFSAGVAKQAPLARGQLDAVDQRLAKEVKRLTAGALGGITLPKL